jgi:hypothetical protein
MGSHMFPKELLHDHETHPRPFRGGELRLKSPLQFPSWEG